MQMKPDNFISGFRKQKPNFYANFFVTNVYTVQLFKTHRNGLIKQLHPLVINARFRKIINYKLILSKLSDYCLFP